MPPFPPAQTKPAEPVLAAVVTPIRATDPAAITRVLKLEFAPLPAAAPPIPTVTGYDDPGVTETLLLPAKAPPPPPQLEPLLPPEPDPHTSTLTFVTPKGTVKVPLVLKVCNPCPHAPLLNPNNIDKIIVADKVIRLTLSSKRDTNCGTLVLNAALNRSVWVLLCPFGIKDKVEVFIFLVFRICLSGYFYINEIRLLVTIKLIFSTLINTLSSLLFNKAEFEGFDSD